MDTSDGEITIELNPSILNGGGEVLGECRQHRNRRRGSEAVSGVSPGADTQWTIHGVMHDTKPKVIDCTYDHGWHQWKCRERER